MGVVNRRVEPGRHHPRDGHRLPNLDVVQRPNRQGIKHVSALVYGHLRRAGKSTGQDLQVATGSRFKYTQVLEQKDVQQQSDPRQHPT